MRLIPTLYRRRRSNSPTTASDTLMVVVPVSTGIVVQGGSGSAVEGVLHS